MALTAKQQAIRRQGIGASEIAALAGLSRYAKPIEIYEAKVHGRPLEESYQLSLGNELEAPIARIWAQQHRKHLALVDTIQHPTKTLAIATPDRAIYADQVLRGDARKKRVDVRDAEGLLQVKSTSWRSRHLWGEDGSDDIPDDFQAQGQWEAHVAGLSSVVFAVDFDKTKLHEYRIVANPNIFNALYEIAAKFWADHVVPRKPPPPDASAAYSEFLSRVFPKETDANYREVKPGSEPELERAVAEFLLLRAADKRLKVQKDKLHQVIRNGIGLAGGIKGAFGTISYKKTKDRTKFNVSQAFEDAVQFMRLKLSVAPTDATAQAVLTHLENLRKEHTTTTEGWRSLRMVSIAEHLKFESEINLTLANEGEEGKEE